MCLGMHSCVLLTLFHRPGWASDWNYNPDYAYGPSFDDTAIEPGYLSRDRETRNSHDQVLSFRY